MVDDQLSSWDKVKGQFKEGSGILIGNGASQAIWEKFGYQSLYDRAKSGVDHPLSTEDRDVFKSLQTKNFELVLGALSTAIKITKILHKDETFVQERYENIQRALVEAVHSVHVRWDKVPQETLLQIQSAILQFEFVFSTNYDLLLYWAIMADNATGEFKDYFWGESQEFDLTDTETSVTATKVLYLHGGLHLYRLPSGATIKRKAEAGQSLLDLFGVPLWKALHRSSLLKAPRKTSWPLYVAPTTCRLHTRASHDTKARWLFLGTPSVTPIGTLSMR